MFRDLEPEKRRRVCFCQEDHVNSPTAHGSPDLDFNPASGFWRIRVQQDADVHVAPWSRLPAGGRAKEDGQPHLGQGGCALAEAFLETVHDGQSYSS